MKQCITIHPLNVNVFLAAPNIDCLEFVFPSVDEIKSSLCLLLSPFSPSNLSINWSASVLLGLVGVFFNGVDFKLDFDKGVESTLLLFPLLSTLLPI